MILSAKDLKAIKWYADAHGLRPQISSPPKMYFTDFLGNQAEADLLSIHQEYDAWNKEDKKERAREKKAAEMRSMIRRVI